MEVTGGAEEGFIREWTPCSHILNLIPPRIQTGIFSSELCLTCVDAVSEYIALGTNVGLVYWYDRKKGNIQRLRCELLELAVVALNQSHPVIEGISFDMIHFVSGDDTESLFESTILVFGSYLAKLYYVYKRTSNVSMLALYTVDTNVSTAQYKASNSPITYVKIVSTVDYMVGAGNAAGQVTVFQIPKEHPDNIPDNFKPKVEPKVERYTIGDLHKSKITAIEWSKNGMRLFSGDKNGVIIMTEIDFYMHLCKSMEIVNEQHEIVQMSYYQNSLLVSSVYRSIMCERRDGRWQVRQLGKRERKTLCSVGAVWQYSYASGGAPRAYCARPGLRVWRADAKGEVLQTLLFKDAISNPLTVAELLNPSATRHTQEAGEFSLGPLHVFREQLLCAHDQRVLLLLDPRVQRCVACVDQLRRILSVSVNKDEIFVLEGPRSLVRLAPAPEPAALSPEDPLNLMTKSLTTSLQHAVNTTTTLIDQTVPYISSVLEQPISMFTKNELLETTVPGEECFELPPIKHLPVDISGDVLESIINEFRDVSSDVEEIRRAKSEELQKKLKLYNSYMERSDEELIHSSRRSRRREGGSGGNTPRKATPVRKEGVTTTPCVMQVSVYSDVPQQNDELLEQEIAEKEKILAKMLNLDSLSIAAPTDPDVSDNTDTDNVTYNQSNVTYNQNNVTYNQNNVNNRNEVKTDSTFKHLDLHENKTPTRKPNTDKAPIQDLVPKVMKLPNNWNLDLELKLDMKNGFKDRLVSPDDHLDSEWEII